MLVQTTNALKQELQMGQELSATLQGKIAALADATLSLSTQIGNISVQLQVLEGEVREEMEVRERSIRQLIGE